MFKDYIPALHTPPLPGRPGQDDNLKWGSLQADGTVKPYRAPAHQCIGALKDKTGHARD